MAHYVCILAFRLRTDVNYKLQKKKIYCQNIISIGYVLCMKRGVDTKSGISRRMKQFSTLCAIQDIIVLFQMT